MRARAAVRRAPLLQPRVCGAVRLAQTRPRSRSVFDAADETAPAKDRLHSRLRGCARRASVAMIACHASGRARVLLVQSRAREVASTRSSRRAGSSPCQTNGAGGRARVPAESRARAPRTSTARCCCSGAPGKDRQHSLAASCGLVATPTRGADGRARVPVGSRARARPLHADAAAARPWRIVSSAGRSRGSLASSGCCRARRRVSTDDPARAQAIASPTVASLGQRGGERRHQK